MHIYIKDKKTQYLSIKPGHKLSYLKYHYTIKIL